MAAGDDAIMGMMKETMARSNSAMSMAFPWRHTGDAKYRDAAVRLLNPEELTWPKSFGRSLRSMSYALYYLSDVQ